jgi:cation diffusion facilitator family transporter
VAINGSFAVNVLLFVLKVSAAVWSGSLAVLASGVDSALDLATGTALFFAARNVERGATSSYPVGRARTEPVVLVALASVMALGGALLVQQSITALAEGIANGGKFPRIDGFTFGTFGATIAAKLFLFVFCRTVSARMPGGESLALRALAVDHLNDVLTNGLALIAAGLVLAARSLWFMDPLFAGLLGLFILYRWVEEGLESARMLVGTGAPPEVISELARVVYFHDRRIVALDTIRAYHVGARLFLEVDIQLAPKTPLHEAHDIGETLQLRLEHAADVERAFVHLDFESVHTSADEHVLNHRSEATLLESGAVPSIPTQRDVRIVLVDGSPTCEEADLAAGADRRAGETSQEAAGEGAGALAPRDVEVVETPQEP